MTEIDISYLINAYHRRLRNPVPTYHRYLYEKINWSARLIGIMGMRGVGKTTMLLQRIKEAHGSLDESLYASLDSLWFKTHTLLQLVEYLDSRGIKYLYLDEVHRYENWAVELKEITDTYPDIHIVYTGSSIIKIDHSRVDLSRRQTLYNLAGLSFREYLNLRYGADLRPLDLQDILQNHVQIAMEISSKLKVLKSFDEYVRGGVYPFSFDAQEDYYLRLVNVINTVIDVDLPSVENVSQETIEKAKKLVMVIAESVPTEVKLKTLFEQISTTRDAGLKILNMLERADILMLLSNKPKNYKKLTIPEKLYLSNGNIMYALTDRVDVGNLRETFFLNQTRVSNTVSMPQVGDFKLDEKYLFEVGGKNKKFTQIADVPNSYLAVDDTEIGYGARIPLWIFGFLY